MARIEKFYLGLPKGPRDALEKRLWEGSLTLRRRFLDSQLLNFAGKARFNYLEFGDPKAPPLVFLHGFADEKHNFFITGKFLSKHFRVIVPDVPGFGDSVRDLNASYSLEQYSLWFQEFFDALGLKRFHLMGNSLGGAISLRLALDCPERIMSLVLVDNAGVHPEDPTHKSVYDEFVAGQNMFLLQGPHEFDQFLNRVFVKRPLIPLPIKNYLAQDFYNSREWYKKLMDDLTLASASKLGTQNALSWEERIQRSMNPYLSGINIPTLIIWGEMDTLFPMACADILHRAIKGSQKIIYANVGHSPQAEIPFRFARDLVNFLKQRR